MNSTESKNASPRKRGFACMPREQVQAISRKGGRAAHVAGTAHEFTPNEAREAGRKGGKRRHELRQAELQAQEQTTSAPASPPQGIKSPGAQA